jgi:hypothetical protein
MKNPFKRFKGYPLDSPCKKPTDETETLRGYVRELRKQNILLDNLNEILKGLTEEQGKMIDLLMKKVGIK